MLEDIKKYGKENFKKEIIEYCNKENLGEREEYWIDYFDAVKSNNFYNIRSQTSGWYNKNLNKEKYDYVCNKIREGNLGKIHGPQSKETCLKKSLKAKGKPKPKGFGDRISKLKKGKPLPNGTGDKISKAKLNHPCFQTESFKEKHSSPVNQKDKDGNIINKFKSINEAANSNELFKRSNISCCLTGKSKTAYGFIWEYN